MNAEDGGFLIVDLPFHVQPLLPPPPLPSVPGDYDQQLKRLRSQLRLSQQALAQHIGAAGKVVVYQWESRKRTPSPVFWQRIQ